MSKLRIKVLSLAPFSQTQKQRLKNIGTLTYADAFLHDSNEAEKCRGADILIVTPRLHQDVVAVLEHCKLISIQAVGTDCIDVAAATRKGIPVCNVGRATLTGIAVAEHALALLLALTKKLEYGNKIVREGSWKTGVAYQPTGLTGKILGIVGFGKIGQHIASIVRNLGLQIIVWTPHPEKYRHNHPDIKFVELAELFRTSDFAILAIPGTAETEGMINANTLAIMKSTALLINVGRGRVIVEKDVVEALRTKQIGGLATDVFVDEPPSIRHPFFSLENVLVTPHIAGSTQEAINDVLEQSVANVEAFLAGRPINIVNPQTLRSD